MAANYCTLNDVKDVLSESGVKLRLDDLPPTAADGNILDEASATIDEYCLLGYSAANLAVSRWVKHRCKVIAAVLLCGRRNCPIPSALEKRYDKLIEDLERVRIGKLFVPDIPMSAANVPQLINGRVALHPIPHFRVQKARSMGQPTNFAEKVDYLDILDYII